MLVRAAENLASLIKNPTTDLILPNPFDKEVAKTVAQAIY
jgi:malic enzyme